MLWHSTLRGADMPLRTVQDWIKNGSEEHISGSHELFRQRIVDDREAIEFHMYLYAVDIAITNSNIMASRRWAKLNIEYDYSIILLKTTVLGLFSNYQDALNYFLTWG